MSRSATLCLTAVPVNAYTVPVRIGDGSVRLGKVYYDRSHGQCSVYAFHPVGIWILKVFPCEDVRKARDRQIPPLPF